jgi:hypothetical protein
MSEYAAVGAYVGSLGIPAKGEELFNTENWESVGRTFFYVQVTGPQAATIERVFRSMVSRSSVEVKSWEVHASYAGSVWVSVVVGMRGDEGTAAEVYCRDRIFCRVGKRGGLSAFVRNKTTGKHVKVTGRKVLWQAVERG